jgi:hypothetical protein
MINYPAIQQKMREEIKNVCGDSLPSLAHRARLAKIGRSNKSNYTIKFVLFFIL